MNRAERVLIPCQITGKGMFPTEVEVAIKTVEGNVVTILADSSLLLEAKTGERLRATCLSKENDISVCVLPTEDTATGSRWIRMRSSDLEFA
jgi:hypothetical protein